MSDEPTRRRRSMIVAFEEVPTTLARLTPTVRMEGDDASVRWCGACREEVSFDEHFVTLKPLYRTSDLSGECVKCGLDLKELAAL